MNTMTTITIERAILDRLVCALDTTVLPKSRDGMMQKLMEDLRDAMAAPATAPEVGPENPSWDYERLDRLLSMCLSGTAYKDYLDSLKRVAKKSTAPEQPSWQDAPTCAGLWVSDYGKFEVEHVNQADVNSFDVAYNAGGRWYGPIPQDGE